MKNKDGLADKIISLPSTDEYRQADRLLLDRLYEGLQPDDYESKLKRCRDYLHIEDETLPQKHELHLMVKTLERAYLHRKHIQAHQACGE